MPLVHVFKEPLISKETFDKKCFKEMVLEPKSERRTILCNNVFIYSDYTECSMVAQFPTKT